MIFQPDNHIVNRVPLEWIDTRRNLAGEIDAPVVPAVQHYVILTF